jgi:hypothetical protein
LIQLDLGAKSPESRDGVDQALGIQIIDRTGFGHDISVTKVGDKFSEAVENTLEKAVTIPMDEGH